MPKNRKSSAHNYKMQAKNEVLINYRQEHIKAYNRNQKFTRHILLYSLLSMIYFPMKGSLRGIMGEDFRRDKLAWEEHNVRH